MTDTDNKEANILSLRVHDPGDTAQAEKTTAEDRMIQSSHLLIASRIGVIRTMLDDVMVELRRVQRRSL